MSRLTTGSRRTWILPMFRMTSSTPLISVIRARRYRIGKARRPSEGSASLPKQLSVLTPCLPATGAQESRRPKPLKNWSGQKDSNPRDIDITGAAEGFERLRKGHVHRRNWMVGKIRTHARTHQICVTPGGGLGPVCAICAAMCTLRRQAFRSMFATAQG